MFYLVVEHFQHLALEMQALQTDSHKYTPLPVTSPKTDNTAMVDQQSIPYSQFLVIVKQQVSCAKDMYDLLSEFVRNFVKTWITLGGHDFSGEYTCVNLLN